MSDYIRIRSERVDHNHCYSTTVDMWLISTSLASLMIVHVAHLSCLEPRITSGMLTQNCCYPNSIDAIDLSSSHGKRHQALSNRVIIRDKLALTLCHQHFRWELD